MNKILFLIFVLLLAVAGVYYASTQDSAQLPTEAEIEKALLSAQVDVSDFGGDKVTLEEGEASFGTTPSSSFPEGFVGLTDKKAVLFNGSVAQVYTILNINGGGSGTFQYLAWFEFNSENQTLTEKQKILLGDRIIVDSVNVNQTAGVTGSGDVLVELKDRLPGEAMAAVPTQAKVLHFTHTDAQLVLADVALGTIAEPQVLVTSPVGTVGTQFVVTGAARGPWFFEANLPIEIKDLSGTTLLQVGAVAQGEWMTTQLVPFTASIQLPAGTNGPHILVIRKDNPSGLPENDASFETLFVVE